MSEDGVITEISAERTYNLGNYESLKVGARVSVPLCGSVENAEKALVEEIERLKRKMLGEKEDPPSSPAAKKTRWVAVEDQFGFKTYHEEVIE